jgi:hypothetical protein
MIIGSPKLLGVFLLTVTLLVAVVGPVAVQFGSRVWWSQSWFVIFLTATLAALGLFCLLKRGLK